jgi:phosphatidylethanolamine-binding protein (PEBP) family uncharacterized protein
VPLTKPAVHCVALIDPSRPDPQHLEAGALSAHAAASGVRVLRSSIGRGYHGPEQIKSHGPHRYTFQLFALAAAVSTTPDGIAADRPRPRALLRAIAGRDSRQRPAHRRRRTLTTGDAFGVSLRVRE